MYFTLMRLARITAGLTQSELASRMGTSQSAVARWESGAVSPSVETFDRLLRACGFQLEGRLRRFDDHDLGLAQQAQRLSAEQRLDQMVASVHFAEELRDAAGRSA